MPKFGLRFTLAILTLSFALNYAWVHAASVAAFSTSCDAELLTRSSSSVAKLYGSVTSNPIIRCINSPSFGLHVSHGSTNFAPALPPVILIGPQGNNVDIIAHEWAHAELFQRLGFVRRELSVPTWLDEGLAMQVDDREQYNFESLKQFRGRSDLVAPTFESMNSTNFFVSGDQGKYNYALSKCLVSQWISDNGNWLDQIGAAEDELLLSLMGRAGRCI